MKGIDISRYQGTDIDFKKIKAAGYDFVIINAGYGNSASQEDPQFDKNAAGAIAAGLYVSAYYVGYATSIADTLKEAATFRGILTPYVGKFLFPVAYDYEYAGCNYYLKKMGVYPSRSALTAMVYAFLADMRKHGWFVANYTNCDFIKSKLYASQLIDFPTWLADYSGGPDFTCTMQQTSEKGVVPGINGHLVDLDTSFVDYPTIIRASGLNGFKNVPKSLVCDTTAPVPLKSGGIYTASITSPTAPVMTVGSAGILKTVLTPQGNNNYLFRVVAIGRKDQSAGVYANGKLLFSVNIL